MLPEIKPTTNLFYDDRRSLCQSCDGGHPVSFVQRGKLLAAGIGLATPLCHRYNALATNRNTIETHENSRRRYAARDPLDHFRSACRQGATTEHAWAICHFSDFGVWSDNAY
jgi:hypothetical protein